jgi:hypothetical protein
VGVTEAGFKAQQLKSFMNVKTAEKSLQFCTSKCKSMLVSKNKENVFNNIVDDWIVKHEENKKTGDTDLVEDYGFVISSTGENMANICQMKYKSM